MDHSHTDLNRPAMETAETWLSVEYINAHGLNHNKLEQLTRRLRHNTIIFVAETWHIDEARQCRNACVVAIGPEPYRAVNSRGKGGLMLLAHDSVKHELRSIITDEHTISIRLHDLTISAVYLPPSMDNDKVQATLESLPAQIDMVMGDLNVRLGRHTRSTDTERSDTIARWCSQRGLALKVPDSEIWSSKIDHIMAKPNRAVKDYTVIEAPIRSDHPLISIKIRTSHEGKGRHTARFNIRKLGDAKYKARFIHMVETDALKVREAYLRLRRSSGRQNTDHVAVEFLDNQLLCLAQTALDKCLGRHMPSGNYTHGRTVKPTETDITSAIMTMRSALREYNAKSDLVAQDETLSPEEEAVKHYTAIYKRTVIAPREQWLATDHTEPEAESSQTIADAIRAYPSGKSPGIDGIDRRALLVLTEAHVFMECLTALYNLCLTSGITPRRWNTSVISPIPKQGKDPKYIANRRPVALTALFRRIFEKLILHKITSSAKLNRGQAGFRNGFSCATQVLLAEQARHNGQGIRVFLDLKCAYDSVPVDKVAVKLANKGVSHYLVRLVESLLSDCSTVIAINGTLTRPVTLEKGLFQGSLLSPILFDVFIDDLAAAINTSDVTNETPECLLFADDILLQSETERRMLALLDTTLNWCDANHMTINVPKSGTTHKGISFFIKGEQLPQVETYRYLGIPLSSTGIEPKGLTEENIRRATGVLALVKKSLAGRLWPPAIKINIYKLYIRSVMEYSAPILILLDKLDLHKRDIARGIKAMQKIQDDSVKWALRRKRPLATLESMAGLTSIQLRFEELTARFRLHLMNVSSQNPIRFWTENGRGSGITNIGATYLIPRDKKVETIRAKYRADSFLRAARTNRMAGYITESARMDNGMDSCLCIQNAKVRSLAISWRCNTFGMYYVCKSCNTAFTRRHVNCIEPVIGREIRQSHERAIQEGQHVDTYTILDHILNLRKFHLFAKIAETLRANLSKGPRP